MKQWSLGSYEAPNVLIQSKTLMVVETREASIDISISMETMMHFWFGSKIIP